MGVVDNVAGHSRPYTIDGCGQGEVRKLEPDKRQAISKTRCTPIRELSEGAGMVFNAALVCKDLFLSTFNPYNLRKKT